MFYYFFVQGPTIPKRKIDDIHGAVNPPGSGVLTMEQAENHVKMLVAGTNNHPNSTWTAEVNPWAVGLTTLDQQAFVISNDSIDEELLKALQEMNEVIKGDLFMEYYDRHIARLRDIPFVPTNFDSAEKWPACADSINKIFDQGGCGSCFVISTVSQITDRICIATNGSYKREISAQDLLECCYFCGSCNGTLDPFTPFIYWYEHGIHTADCYPYTISTDCGHPCLPDTFINPKGLGECKGRRMCRRPGEQAKYIYKIGSIHDSVSSTQRSLANAYYDRYNEQISTEELLKREIMTHGPVVLCFNVFEGFMHYKKGVYNVLNGTEGPHIYDHCVKITGWGIDKLTGSEYLKAINSWSEHWATDGTFLISIDTLRHLRSDLYGGIPRL